LKPNPKDKVNTAESQKAEEELEKQRRMEDLRRRFMQDHGDEFIPRDMYFEQLDMDDPAMKKREIATKMGWTRMVVISEILKIASLIFIGAIPFIISLITLNMFNEITVSQCIYQLVMLAIPNLLDYFVFKVDFPVLYIKELRLVKTQIIKSLKMFIILIAAALLVVACWFDFYEINDLRLLIPALEFKTKMVHYGLRTTYLTIIFLEFVIGMPVIEQRFFFIFFSNMIGEMKNFQDQIPLNIGRNGMINQLVIFGYHACTYLPVIYKSFSENTLQMIAVFLLTMMVLIAIHALRAEYGVIASITAHAIFNLTLFGLLCVIYFTDYLHKGFIAEQFTTLNKNAIDFIFGQNEGYADNT